MKFRALQTLGGAQLSFRSKLCQTGQPKCSCAEYAEFKEIWSIATTMKIEKVKRATKNKLSSLRGNKTERSFRKVFSNLTAADLGKLLISIIIDLLGMVTYGIPGIGEFGDVVWAPLSTVIIFFMYGNGVMAALNFAEEILPMADVVPSATIAWVWERMDS